MLGTIIDVIGGIGETIINIPSLIWEFVKDIPVMIFELFKSLIEGILNCLNFILESILTICSFILDFFSNLFKFISYIFVPSSDYFTNEFSNLLSSIADKFSLDFSAFESLRNVKDSKIDDIKLSVMGVNTIISMDVVNNIASFTRAISTGCVVLFSILFNYNKVVFILRGKYAIETRKG